MSPPTFNDLGKSSRDLFNKGYAHGFLKFDSTTKGGDKDFLEFKTAASHNITSQKLLGNLEVKYKFPQYGGTLTEKWNTDNTLGTVVEIKDQFAKGLKVTLDTSYVPHTAKRGGVIKTEWAGDMLKVNADMTLSGGPLFTIAGVVAKGNYLIGGQAKFDLATNELKTTSVALGTEGPEHVIHAFTNDGREFGASFFHKANKNLELGGTLGWTVADQICRFGLASKYRVNNDLTVRAKVSSNSQVAISATHDLSTPGLKLTLSTIFSLLNNSDASNNKFGLGLEYTN